MSEFFLSIPVLFSSQAVQLLAMFASSFLSATVIPANSEIVFATLASPLLLSQSIWSWEIFWLFLVASLGNTLGGLTTYWLGRLFPDKATASANKQTAWALDKLKRYGAVLLLLSWMPIIGDALCAIAGWLRLNAKSVFCFMLIGKAARYAVLLASIHAVLP